jgi:hypothetical protein
MAYVNISDGTNSLVWTQAGAATPNFTVGTAPITATAVYVLPGGTGGNGENGATVDSWDETTAGLLNDPPGGGPDFVTVSPDDTAGDLTNDGNNNGFVPTNGGQETISALSSIAANDVSFVQWVNLLQNVPVPQGQPQPWIPVAGDVNLVAPQNSNYLALAFYKAIPAPPLTTCERELANFRSLTPQGENIAVLEFYRQALSRCVGPQYAAAVSEINALLKEGPPRKI